MAKGITQRTSLSLSESDMGDSMTLGRQIKRWADTLPFGSFGFQVARTTDLAVAAATTVAVGFDTIVRDYEGWTSAAVAPYDKFVVPREGSGLYAIEFSDSGDAGGATGAVVVRGTQSGSNNIAVAATVAFATTASTMPVALGETIDIVGSVTVTAGAATSGQVFAGFVVNGLAGFQAQTAKITLAANGQMTIPIVGWYTAALTLPLGNVNVGLYVAFSTFGAGTMVADGGRVIARKDTDVSVGGLSSVIHVNGVAVGSSNQPALVWLNDYDVLEVSASNTSASSITLSADTASTTVSTAPLFTCVRVSLI